MNRKGDVRSNIDKADFTQTTDDDTDGFARLINSIDGTEFLKFDAAGSLGYDRSISSDVGSGTTSVEGTEGQLRTRLTNGLCSDNTDSFALLDHTCGS